MNVSKMKIGDKFDSFQELEKSIAEYEQQNYVQLYKRDCRTLNLMMKSLPNRCKNANKTIKYYSLVYACKKGGRRFKSKSKGFRTGSTAKSECPMKIRIILSLDGKSLAVDDMSEEHNHSIIPEEFKNLPRQRKLNQEEMNEVATLMKSKCNKKLLLSYVRNKTGKKLLLHDLNNIRFSVKDVSQHEIESIVNILKEKENSTVAVLVNDDNVLDGIFFQDGHMKRCFEAWPEILLMNANYSLNNIKIYILMVVNGNGEGEVVGTFLLVDKNEDVLRSMIQCFKSANPAWENVETIITDEDFAENAILSQEFANASQKLCVFHVLKTIRSAINSELLKIPKDKRHICLELVERMAYSSTVSEYLSYYEQLQTINVENFVDYYSENWHPIKHRWVDSCREHASTFNTSTTNHAEMFNQKLEQICDKLSNLSSFYVDFLVLLYSTRSLRRENAHKMSYRDTNLHLNESPLCKYERYLTPFAYNFVDENIRLSLNETFELVDNGLYYHVISADGTECRTTLESCDCPFRLTMKLPCNHIFAVRRFIKEPLFCERLVDPRYTKELYVMLQTNNFNAGNENSIDNASESFDNQIVLSELDVETTSTSKYKEAYEKCQTLAAIMSDLNDSEFEKHCVQIDFLIEAWSKGKRTLIELDVDDVSKGDSSDDRGVKSIKNEYIVKNEQRDVHGAECETATLEQNSLKKQYISNEDDPKNSFIWIPM